MTTEDNDYIIGTFIFRVLLMPAFILMLICLAICDFVMWWVMVQVICGGAMLIIGVVLSGVWLEQ